MYTCVSIYEKYGSDGVILGYNLELNCHEHENCINLCIPLFILIYYVYSIAGMMV